MIQAFCSDCREEVELEVVRLDAGTPCPRCGARDLGIPEDARAADPTQQQIDRDEFSHRLRTPLTVVKGSLQHLLRHWDALADRDRKVLVKALLGQTDQVIEVVASFEDRLSAGKPRESVELDESTTRR